MAEFSTAAPKFDPAQLSELYRGYFEDETPKQMLNEMMLRILEAKVGEAELTSNVYNFMLLSDFFEDLFAPIKPQIIGKSEA